MMQDLSILQATSFEDSHRNIWINNQADIFVQLSFWKVLTYLQHSFSQLYYKSFTHVKYIQTNELW